MGVRAAASGVEAGCRVDYANRQIASTEDKLVPEIRRTVGAVAQSPCSPRANTYLSQRTGEHSDHAAVDAAARRGNDHRLHRRGEIGDLRCCMGMHCGRAGQDLRVGIALTLNNGAIDLGLQRQDIRDQNKFVRLNRRINAKPQGPCLKIDVKITGTGRAGGRSCTR